jgi:thioredoxin reductase (NADPH)
VQIKNLETSETTTLSLGGVFIAIGMVPNTAWLKDLVPLDQWGFILTNESMATKIPGIFAAGDVRSKLARQISTAVGDGTIATIAAERYLEGIK